MRTTDKTLSKPKNQHWVPRFYLKEFSIPETKNTKNSQVWIFSRHSGEPQRVNIKNIASKKYLYTRQNEDGTRCWKVEEKLASLESTLSNFWHSIANEFVDLDAKWVRKGISLFIATLILRHPITKYNHKVMQDELIAFFDDLPKDNLGIPNISHITSKHGTFQFDKSDWFKYSNPTEHAQHNFFIDMIEQDAIEIATLLMEKRWSVIFSEEPCFITTDCPVAIENIERERFGLATKGTSISIPLSPTRVLMLDDRFDEPSSQYYPLSINSASINIAHWIRAYNFMISHRNPDEVNYEMVSFADKYEQQT